MNIELAGASARHPAARAGTAAVLRSLNLTVKAGEQIAVIGPSGAGKTTLLQVLACALPLSGGELRLGDQSPWHLPRPQLQKLRGRLFLAPQVPPLPPRQRVVTSVLAGRLPAMGLLASVRSLFYPVDIPAAFDALDRFDLADKLFDRVDRLSGGERQRVGLARALLSPASLWLVDEPLSALDPVRARQALHTLTDVARERGVTLVSTLHQVDVALAQFPRVVGLREGAVAFDLPSTQVTQQHIDKLYYQHEDELREGASPQQAFAPQPAAPVVMTCR